jgi:hypothetical protein
VLQCGTHLNNAGSGNYTSQIRKRKYRDPVMEQKDILKNFKCVAAQRCLLALHRGSHCI